jgi:NAD(P)-dependent dehydrogenase (short-subunit alcohol dehydrogenase family)
MRRIGEILLQLLVDGFEGLLLRRRLYSRGAFLFAQHILPLLQSTVSQSPIYPPTLIFTGATASTKGSALFAPFAAGKFAQKALAQSLAREFGPKGVHVGHVVIDGVIDIPRTKEWKVSDHPDSKISPEGIAAEYWHLHTQNRTAWAFEVDLRPWVEKW